MKTLLITTMFFCLTTSAQVEPVLTGAIGLNSNFKPAVNMDAGVKLNRVQLAGTVNYGWGEYFIPGAYIGIEMYKEQGFMLYAGYNNAPHYNGGKDALEYKIQPMVGVRAYYYNIMTDLRYTGWNVQMTIGIAIFGRRDYK